MRILFILALLVAVPVSAQVVQTEAGTSSLFNATGGSAKLYFPNQIVTVGVGVSAGRLVAGASDEFDFHGWQVTAGDSQLFFTGEGAGLAISERGLAVRRKRPNSTLDVFVATCGSTFSAPWYEAQRTTHACVGYSFRRTVLPNLEIGSFAVAEQKLTAIESARYHWRAVVLAGSAGLLNSDLFLNGSAAVTLPHFSANAQRQTQLFDGLTINTTSFSASGMIGPVDVHGSEFISRFTGYSFGAGIQESIFHVRVDFQHSGSTSIVSNTLMAKISRHLQLTGTANESRGQWYASYGGQITSNLASVAVSHSIQFLPLRGFQQVLSASVSFQLPHSASLTASTVTLPDGQVKYSVYGGSYFTGPLAGGTQAAVRHAPSAGKFVIRGMVRDIAGAPVDGAAVLIGDQLALTDSTGAFFVRFKHAREYSVRVEFSEFTAPGSFRVVSAPSTARPGEDVRIVIERKP